MLESGSDIRYRKINYARSYHIVSSVFFISNKDVIILSAKEM